MPVTSTTLGADVGKWIQDSLIERVELMHRLPRYAEKVTLPPGNGKTANFTRYNRTDVPVDKLTEGTTPTETAFTVSTQAVTVDQWGLYISLTDVGIITIRTPILNEAMDLVADAIARCQDYNLAEVLNASTNKQYWDGVLRANRGAITATDYLNAAVLNKARAGMNNDNASPREGDFFVALMSPQVEADLFADTGFVAAHQTTKQDNLIKGHVGDWYGMRIIRSNFLPKFTRIATFTSVVESAAGGALAGTLYYKVTRKNLARGFEEDIHVQVTLAITDTRLIFTAPSTAGYVYNIYAGSVTGDANLFLAKENLQAGAIYNLDALPTSGANPPATPAASVTVHPIYVFGAKAVDYVELSGSSMSAKITPKGISDSDPLEQRRKIGAKYMAKAGIRDATRVKVIEVASAF